MSFLDEPDPAPRDRPRRRSGTLTVDRQTLMVRRTVAAGVGVLLLVLIILGIRGCLNARKRQSFKDYVGEVSGLIQESNQQGSSLFKLLSAPGGRDQAVTLQNDLNGFRLQSAQLVDRAKSVSHPGQVSDSQSSLVETLKFRRDGLAAISDALPTALSDRDRRAGTNRIAADMQTLLTSDVIYSQRFVPSLRRALKDEGLLDQVSPPHSRFFPDISWLDPGTVSDRLSEIRTGRGGRPAKPGSHGTGLGSVNLGGQTLAQGGSTSLTLASGLSFQVQVTNQGNNDETDIPVRVTIGRGPGAIDLDGRIATIAAGETKTINIPLKGTPPAGQPVPITVNVETVPGEKMVDNNKGTFSAIFTR
jgi:hypothetical protein